MKLSLNYGSIKWYFIQSWENWDKLKRKKMSGSSPNIIFRLHLNWGETLFFNFFSLTKFFFYGTLLDTGYLRVGKMEANVAPIGMLIKLCWVKICRVVARGIGALAKPMRTIYLHLFTFFNFTLSFLFHLPFLKKLIHMISAAF